MDPCKEPAETELSFPGAVNHLDFKLHQMFIFNSIWLDSYHTQSWDLWPSLFWAFACPWPSSARSNAFSDSPYSRLKVLLYSQVDASSFTARLSDRLYLVDMQWSPCIENFQKPMKARIMFLGPTIIRNCLSIFYSGPPWKSLFSA